MKYCTCYCNGSWSCPDRFVEDTCGNEETTSSPVRSSGCQTCSVEGQNFAGNQYFQVKVGCIDYRNCICYCNGSWSCPDSGARNVCDGGEGYDVSLPAGCRHCDVNGQRFPGNQYFETTDGCIEYKNCICHCNGSWSCPGESARNTCQENDRRGADSGSCRSCEVYGQTFPGNQYFQVRRGCIEYENCICRCDGSWDCPGESARDVCRGQEEGVVDTGSCRNCEVYGQSFPGNRYFQVQPGCIAYKDCICHCNGSWSCPAERARDTCRDEARGTVDTGSCRTCEVYGQTFPGNQYFQVQQGCIEYRNCICRCNGSWSCPGESARNICDNNAAANTGARETTSVTTDCSSCVAYGQTFEGGDYFDVVDGCTSYKNCICRCDGSWNCNDRFAENICQNTTRPSSSESRGRVEVTETRRNYTVSTASNNRCSYCEAKSKIIRGNTYFELTDGCVKYKNCICHCNGSWNCPIQFAENICTSNEREAKPGICTNCVARGKIIEGNTNFELIEGCTRYPLCRCHCNGSYDCSADRAQDICFNNGSSVNTACSLCQARDGSVHQPNSQFRLVEDCIEYNCDCFCNGSWNCPPDRSRWVCQDRCLQCDVNGRKVENNTQFVHRTGCLEYTCDCHCNGSWSCPGRTARNTCPAGVRDNCNKCVVSETEQYEGESDFVLKQGCLEYKCRCNCDGSYNCPGRDARNVCRGETIGGCRSCVVSDSEYYTGETDFTMRKQCIHYECRCNCDGSWSCPAEKARNFCLGEVPGGCRICRVADNEIYRAGTEFDLRQDCLVYKCQCNCNGSWFCPGEKARDVCKGEVPGGCKSCVISENEYYRGNTNFEMVKNCIHYKCRCNCDGGYHCPGRTARRVCQSGASTSAVQASACRKCKVSETEQFPGNSTFYLDRGCHRYECSCGCDGGYECPPDKTRDTCARDPARISQPDECKSCKIGKDEYPGNSSFKFTRRCYQFDCTCACTGRWSCDHRNPNNICRDQKLVTSERTLTSTTGAARTREDYTASSSSQETSQTSESGSTFSETDIRSQTGSSSDGRYGTRTNTRVNPNTRTSTTETRVNPNTRTSTTETRVNPNTRMSTTETRVNPNTRPSTTYPRANPNARPSTTNTRVNTNNCRPCSVNGRAVQTNQAFSFERGCLLYRNCRCLCDGRWQCTDQVNRCESRPPVRVPTVPEGGRSYRTETKTATSTSTEQRQVDSSAWVYVDGVDTSFYTSGDEKTGGGYKVQVDTRYSPYSSHGYRRQFGQYQENQSPPTTFFSSGLSPDTSALHSSSSSSGSSGSSGSSSSSSSHSSHSSSGSASTRPETHIGAGTDQCLRCEVDTKTYPSGAHFDMRRGCVVYKCLCLCSGSYRCRLTSDNDCSTDERHSTCSNCLYQGMVFPGNMRFTVREGCIEKQCNCNCNGTHDCPTSKPLPGCTAATANGQPFSGYGNLYPIHPGLFPVRSGHITNTGKAVYTSVCTTCQPGGQGRRVVHHVPINPAQGGGNGVFVNPGDPSVNVGQSGSDGTCSGCFVNGGLRPGNSKFSFTKSCVEFDCYCSCGGAWKCGGRLSLECTPGFEPDSVPHTAECRSCVVQGTTYPANARFSLRQGCHEYQCSCNCDGGWSCPAQHPVNRCPEAPTRPDRGNSIDPQTAREDVYVADQGGPNDDEVKITADLNLPGDQQRRVRQQNPRDKIPSTCLKCNVRGTVYPPKSKFFMRSGCIQRLCECQCSGAFSCAEDSIVNICNTAESDPRAPRGRQCRDCRVGSDVFISESEFQMSNGCFQYNCHCHCNGTHECPRDQARNICTSSGANSPIPDEETSRQYNARIQPSVLTTENGDATADGDVLGCKTCYVDGQRIEQLSTFVRKLGCFESICHCQCNGKPACPPSASVNVCELPDKLPMNERKGCKVGRRTHFTRVFAHVENCIQRTCVCHDDGKWTCKRTAGDRKVC